MKSDDTHRKNIHKELRLHKRLPAKESATAAFVTHDNLYYVQTGQIIDMSVRGLGMLYRSISDGYSRGELVRLEILADREPLSFIGIVLCRIAYDLSIDRQDDNGRLQLRRCGVEFTHMSLDQQYRLKRYIHQYTADQQQDNRIQ